MHGASLRLKNLKNVAFEFQGISALADKAKEHAGTLVDAAKSSFDELKGKLSDHVEALKGHAGKLGAHATNAVNALKEAISSITSKYSTMQCNDYTCARLVRIVESFFYSASSWKCQRHPW